jgi:2-oxoglutarate ferredoxin oxidoreductase subunit gamma
VRVEIRVGGFGGQGVALAGYLIGKSASLYQGLEAVVTQAYGPEARGGASSADIIVADAPIDYPFLGQADVLLLLSQEAFTRFRPSSRPGAAVLIDDGLVTAGPEERMHRIPATSLAEGLGRRLVANVVMLGFFSRVTGIVQREAIEKAIETTVPARTLELNLRAFSLGYEYAPEGVRVP